MRLLLRGRQREGTARLWHPAAELGTLEETDFVNWKLLVTQASR